MVYTQREDFFIERLKELNITKSKEAVVEAFHLADKFFMREHPGLLGKRKDLYMNQYRTRLMNHLQLDPDTQFGVSPRKTNKPVWHTFPFTHSTLSQLKEDGYTLGLISNWDSTAEEVLESNDLTKYFECLIISSKIGIEKPDSKIFDEALRKTGFKAEDCLYVGDNFYDDVIGSRKVGMDSVLINPYGQLGIEELDDSIKVIKSIEELPTMLKQSTR